MKNIILDAIIVLSICLGGCAVSPKSTKGADVSKLHIDLTDQYAQWLDDSLSNQKAPPDYVECNQPPRSLTEVKADLKSQGLPSDVHGTAWVKMWVSISGKVKRAEIMHSTNHQINKACLAAALQWKFTQPKNNGIPVELWIVQLFKL
jgi:TonB family protein